MNAPILLTALAAATGALHIRADLIGARRQTYVWKPLTTGLIIAAALLISPVVDGVYRLLIVGGLVFSLAGDVFLMLPTDRFLAGMVSFFVAHLCYIAAFVSLGGGATTPCLLLPLVIGGGVVAVLIWPRLDRLRLPVLLYIVTILVMGWQALGLRQIAGRSLVAPGAILFVLSDAALALDRFRHPIPLRALLVLSAYYPAQALIAWSILR